MAGAAAADAVFGALTSRLSNDGSRLRSGRARVPRRSAPPQNPRVQTARTRRCICNGGRHAHGHTRADREPRGGSVAEICARQGARAALSHVRQVAWRPDGLATYVTGVRTPCYAVTHPVDARPDPGPGPTASSREFRSAVSTASRSGNVNAPRARCRSSAGDYAVDANGIIEIIPRVYESKI